MTAQVVVVLGPARAGKTHELVGRYHDALATSPVAGLDRNLWLAPSSRAAAAVREQLIARGVDACLGPGVLTFDDLAKQIFIASNSKTRSISAVLQRELLRRVIAEALDGGALKHFAEAACRSGFAELLAEHIRELKRHDITPAAYEKIAATRGQPQQHQELARLYADYERQLTSHALRDEEGAHWSARDALASRACPRFQQLDLLVVDGFTDFTRTQHEIIRLLAERAQQLFISLPADAPTPTRRRTGRFSDQSDACGRADLFAKTTATLAELQHYHPHLQLRHLPPRPTTWPTIDYLSESIFRHPKPAPSTDALGSLNQIEIVEAAGAQDEIVQLARRIKQRLTETPLPVTPKKGSELFLSHEGAQAQTLPKRVLTPFSAPSDIVVVFRSVNEVASRVEEVFDRFGIPYSIETSQRIASSPIFKTLVALLQLDQDDWPFRRVVSVLTNNTLTALSAPARQAADWLVRDLQVATGRRNLLEIVGRRSAQHGSEKTLSDHQQQRIQAAAVALPALSQIATALEQLPNEATLTEWTAALAQLGAALALPPFTVPPTTLRTGRLSDQLPPPADAAAWHAIAANFAALERLDAWLDQPPRQLSRHELLTTLIDVATREALPRPHDEVGRVRVLSAPAARSVTARHLYLAGMSEQSFPAALPLGRLATDAEYRFFANAAHQKTNPEAATATPVASRAQDEMLLFYEVLSRAEESLTISYPALDDKAQELPPSPYVVELLRMLGDHAKQIRIAKPQLSPVPQSADSRSAEPRRTSESPCRSARGTYCVPDWRVAAMSQAVQTDGDRRSLAGIFSREDTKSLGQAIDAGVRIVHARARGESFGPSEGLLISPAVAAHLSQRFGASHFWSPSQFETYAACPYKFYLDNVLKLEPLGDLVLETDFARRGSLLHQVLAAFHRKYDESSAGAWSALWRDEPRFVAELKNELQAAIDATPREGLEAAMLELDRRQIDKWTDLYRGQHKKYDDAWSGLDEPPRPTHFELRFGRQHSGEAGHEDPHSTDAAFQLDIGGESINVAGRIDRIDVGRAGEQTVFNVIDYKSGRRPTLTSEKIASGERLQPALYVMAAQALIFGGDDATPLWAGYWSMQGGVTTDKRYSLHCSVESGEPTRSWEELQPKVIARIGEIVRATRHGDFPVASRDINCTSLCDFKTVCRIAQVRSVNKTWPPTAACGLAQSTPAATSDPLDRG